MVQLRIPGPTPVPEDILQIQTKQMINHRGKEFGALFQATTDRLKQLFQTKNDVFILTASGTGGMEAAIVNTLSPGDRVLAVSIGSFGNRFADIAQRFGANVERLSIEWGLPCTPEALRQALSKDSSFKAVLITHNETSTGVTNNLGALAKVVREFDNKLLLVDAISSLGAIDLPVDKWDCDVVITGSQKGWMAPPGIAMVSVGERAWKANAVAKMPRYYWDFAKAKTFIEKAQTPWTPAVSTIFALGKATEKMLAEGQANIFARHARVGKAARDGVKAVGLTLFPKEDCASNTITAVNVPSGVDPKNMLQMLRDEHQVVLSGGQAKLEGKIFRIGHLGWVTEADIRICLIALRATLNSLGFKTA